MCEQNIDIDMYEIKQIGSSTWVVDIQVDCANRNGMYKKGSWFYFRTHKAAVNFGNSLGGV